MPSVGADKTKRYRSSKHRWDRWRIDLFQLQKAGRWVKLTVVNPKWSNVPRSHARKRLSVPVFRSCRSIHSEFANSHGSCFRFALMHRPSGCIEHLTQKITSTVWLYVPAEARQYRVVEPVQGSPYLQHHILFFGLDGYRLD
jgi:hypothetical protein